MVMPTTRMRSLSALPIFADRRVDGCREHTYGQIAAYSDLQPGQFAVEGLAVRRGPVGSDDAQPSCLDGDTSDLVVALPVREQRDVDVMSDGPVAGIGTERPGVAMKCLAIFLVVVPAALRVTGRNRWPC